MTNHQSEIDSYASLPPKKAAILLLSIMVVALCGIVYELIIATVSSYLLGNSVYQFSLTIGFFMFAMGIGSYISRFIGLRLIEAFVWVEMALAIVGGVCSITLFMIFPYAPWLFQTVMFAFIFAIGALVGLEIPLLARVLAERAGTRRSIADVMSLDYIGALVGSVVFPLLLLPSLGLIPSSFVIGLINMLVALINVIWLREYLRFPRLMLGAVIGVLCLLVGLTVSASRITAFAQQHLYFDQIIWQKQTPYQNLVLTQDWPKRDLRLFIDGHIQFSALDEHRYHETLVHPAMGWRGDVKTVLVLGGGDGLAVREVLKHPGVERIDLIDIDPDMTRLGKSFPALVKLNENSLNGPKVHVSNQDAFVFVREVKRKYDRVIIDFPDPHNEAISKLYSVEFYALLSKVMAENAVLVTQSSSPFFARRTYWSIEKTLSAIFPATTSYTISVPSFGVWGFHIAQKNAGGDLVALPDGLKFLTKEAFTAAQVFSADITKPRGTIVNSIFKPTLYQLYLEDMESGPLAASSAM